MVKAALIIDIAIWITMVMAFVIIIKTENIHGAEAMVIMESIIDNDINSYSICS